MKTTIQIPPGSCVDPYLRAFRSGTRFVLEDGNYYTGSGWAFDKDFDHVCLGADCDLIGAGSGRTLLEIIPATVPENALQIEGFTCGSRSGLRPLASFELSFGKCWNEIRGVTIWFSNSVKAKNPSLGLIGLHAWSSRVIIDDVTVCGVTGIRPNREGFGILVNGALMASGPGPRRRGGGSRIANCSVESSGGYVCGVYVGYEEVEGGPTTVDSVRVKGAGTNHAAFGTNGGVIWRAISNEGRWDRAVFCDTAGGERVVVADSILQAERVLVEFRGREGMTWRDIVVQGSILTTTPCPNPRQYAAGLVLASDGGKPFFSGVQIRDCILRASGGDHYLGSIDSPHESCGVIGCTTLGDGDWKPMVVK